MSQADSEQRMPFFSHVDEMRTRITRCAIVFLVGFGLSWGFANDYVMEFLRAPLFEALPEGQRKLHFTHLFENFFTHLKIAGYSSLFLFAPYYFYEFWRFLVPGLRDQEKKAVFPFVLAATLCFLGGAAFAYYVLFPVGFKFFVTFGLESDSPILTIDAYYSTVLKLLLLFGLAFETPVVICILGFMGIIDADFLRKNRRNGILGITVVCAMFAPPDAISMLILMAPLILMYEASIYIVQIFGDRRKRRIKNSQEEKEESDNPLKTKEKNGFPSGPAADDGDDDPDDDPFLGESR